MARHPARIGQGAGIAACLPLSHLRKVRALHVALLLALGDGGAARLDTVAGLGLPLG